MIEPTIFNLVLALLVFVVVVSAIIYLKAGFTLNFGKVGMRVVPKKGLTVKQVEEHVRATFKRYIAGLDTYNQDIARHDQDARVLITHKLDEIQFPTKYPIKDGNAELMRRTVLYDLLTMNMENHYGNAAQSSSSLIFYLADKYKKLVHTVRPFLKNENDCYIVAYEILNQWWSIVGKSIHYRASNDLKTDVSRQDLIQDPTWERKMKATVERHQNIIDSVEDMTSIRPGVLRYFLDEGLPLPEFVKDARTQEDYDED